MHEYRLVEAQNIFVNRVCLKERNSGKASVLSDRLTRKGMKAERSPSRRLDSRPNKRGKLGEETAVNRAH